MRQVILAGAVALGLAGCLPAGGGGGGAPMRLDGAVQVDGGLGGDAGVVDGAVAPDSATGPVADATVPPSPDAGPEPGPDAAVPDAAAPDDPRVDACGDVRVAQKVYYGTREPTQVPLTPGQQLAVGSFDGCTGTLITPTWVLSATHCGHRAGVEFCVPADNDRPDYPDRCVRAIRVVDNPSADQSLLELAQPMTDLVPEVVPVAIQAEPLDRSWVGRTAEAAGYGQVHNGGFNERWFTAEPIARVGEPYLTIDGQGQRGVCFGDSGGPVFVLGDDGQVRVAGDLSHGDPSCVGQDNFTRTDLFADWITGYTGPTGPVDVGPQPCGTVDDVGRCDGRLATWCDGGVLARESCDTCGWSDRLGGFRCLQGNDPCLGFDRAGACDGGVARWCEGGVPRARDCGACGQGCAVQDGLGAHCVDDPCADLDYLGRCDGDQAVWCDDEGFHAVDCGEQNAQCGYVNDRVGYYCQ